MTGHNTIQTEWTDGYQAGWEACESFYANAIRSGDPTFYTWLRRIEDEAKTELLDHLDEQLKQQAAQTADDET